MNIHVQLFVGPLPPTTFPAVDGAGAVLTFEGVVRPLEAGEPITSLVYEAYEPMAIAELKRLSQHVLTRHSLLAVFVQHSTGNVPAGQCSFRLHIASAHRKEALAAMDEFIDRLKQDVPVWKAGR